MILKLLLKTFILLQLLNHTLYAKEPSLEKVSVQLKWFYQFQFAGIIMAKEKGFYRDVGLDVTIKERNPKFNNIDQVITGASEYGVADAAILRYRAQGQPVKVLATIFQHNAMVLISRKGSGILSPYEIKGKKISFQKALDDSVISSLLHFAKLNDKDYIYKKMDFSKMDFVNGEVDVTEAYVSIEPYWIKQKHGIELNVIDPRNYGIDFYGDLLFTTEEEVTNHPERAKAFKKATIKGWEYALTHKEETIQLLLNKYDSRQSFSHDALMYEAKTTHKLISPEYIAIGSVQQERFQVLAELYQRNGMNQKSLVKAVKNIIYVEKQQQESLLSEYRYYFAGVTSVVIVIILFLMANNRRLLYLVHERTEELELAKEASEKAAQSKARFLANMSHEIRTPMNAILGFVEQLAKSETDPKRQKMFHTIESSSQNLLTIINDILDISKFDSGKLQLDIQATDMYMLFHELEEIFSVRLKEKAITYELNIQENAPQYAKVDKTRLLQVLINLVGNAIKFTSEEGKIIVELSFDLPQSHYQIRVIDNGLGIDEKNIDKIFHAFEQEDETTTRRFGGTGLGLSISQKLITFMQGSIRVESKLGVGSEFIIELPYIYAEPIVREDTCKTVASTEIANEHHILIVEDNKTNQMLLSMILEEAYFTFDIANNGEEAVSMFQQKDYDIILMDENMPVMSGIEATKHIRELEAKNKSTIETPEIPIIAVTANALSEDTTRFIDAGMNDYLAKPYSEGAVLELLEKYLSK